MSSSSGDDSFEDRPEAFESLVEVIRSKNSAGSKLPAIRAIRAQLSSIGPDSLALEKRVIDCGLLTDLAQCLEVHNISTLQVECLRIIAIIASGESNHRKSVVDAGITPLILNMSRCWDSDVVRHSFVALSEIIGNKRNFWIRTMELHVIPDLLIGVRADSSAPLLRAVSWIINFFSCSVEPMPSSTLVPQIIPLIRKFLQHSDAIVVMETLGAVSNLCHYDSRTRRMLRDSRITQHLLPLVQRAPQVSFPGSMEISGEALRAFNNVTRDEPPSEDKLNGDALCILPELLTNQTREALLSIFLTRAKSRQQIQALIDAGLLSVIVDGLDSDDVLLRRQGVRAALSFAENGNDAQAFYLYRAGVIPRLCRLLTDEDTTIILNALRAIENICESISERYQREICFEIECSGAIDTLKRLVRHECEAIRKSVLTIAQKLFPDIRKIVEELFQDMPPLTE